MKKYLAENESLMNVLKSRRADGVLDFVSDGIIHPKTWFEKREEKILYFLKEAYSRIKDIEWDLCKWLRGERCMDGCTMDCSECSPRGSTYNHVAEQAYMILNETEHFDAWLGVTEKSRKNYLNARREILKRIAIINIKKYSGKSTSYDKDLWEHLNNENKDILKKQIELIRPTLIICGGTYPYLKEVLGLPNMDPYYGTTVCNGMKIVATYHPSKIMTSKDKAGRVYRLLKENK